MKRSLTLIGLRNVRHNDAQTVMTAYSLEEGRVSLVVAAGAGRGARRIKALTQPLQPLSVVADFVAGRELGRLVEAVPYGRVVFLYDHPVRAMIAQFIAEVLGRVLRENRGDSRLFEFLQLSIDMLELATGTQLANFHMIFLVALARHMGIAPDASGYRPGMVFDMVDGIFRESPPLHRRYLEGDCVQAAALLCRLTYRTSKVVKLSHEQRSAIVDAIMDYYSIHLVRMSDLRTLPVLREL